MKKFLLAAVAAGAFVAPAQAEVFVVSAAGNSSSGGTALATGLTFAVGDAFRVFSSTNDLWSAGELPRFSDGNGLIADRFATAADDSGQPVGTLIGTNFGPYTQDGFTAAFGTLVGRIGGTYYNLGANNSLVTTSAGELELFYWDSNNGDNSGSISFNILNGVPEPATWAMMIMGFGLIGSAMRRAKPRVAVSFA